MGLFLRKGMTARDSISKPTITTVTRICSQACGPALDWHAGSRIKARQFVKVTGMKLNNFLMAFCIAAITLPTQAQSPLDRYIADRDAAIVRFTPEKIPKLEQPQIDAEAKARAALDKQLLAIVGTTPPKGFGAAKSNVGSLFTGDMEFGKLDGLVFEADGGKTQMVVTTLPLLQRWLKGEDSLPKDADQAIGVTDFFTRSVQTDAAILHYADIPLGARRTFAMLSARTQDATPDGADEVFVAAIRGDRVFIANAALKQKIRVPACTKARAVVEKKLEAIEKKEFKPGENNSDLVDRMSKLRDEADADFLKCFAQAAPKDPRFAAAVARAKELHERMPVK